jgi:hypothetical protein
MTWPGGSGKRELADGSLSGLCDYPPIVVQLRIDDFGLRIWVTASIRQVKFKI